MKSMVPRPRWLKWTLLVPCAALTMAGLNQVFPVVWYSPKIEARVTTVDGKPLTGAIVDVNWNIEGPWNGASLGQLAVAEAVTDADGKFEIPAWGPRFNFHGAIRVDEPTTRIFKAGYTPLTIKNYEDVPMRPADRVIVFRLQNQSIALAPFTGSVREYESSLLALQDDLRAVYGSNSGEDCIWKRTPRLLLALQDEKLKMAAQGAGQSLHMAYEFASPSFAPICGNARQFFQEFANE